MKQIVGSTLRDSKDDVSSLVTNFESDKSAGEYASLYKEDGLTGGHVIMLGRDPLSNAAAIEALHAYPGRFIAAFFYAVSIKFVEYDISSAFFPENFSDFHLIQSPFPKSQSMNKSSSNFISLKSN